MDFIQPTAYGREPAKHEIIPLGHGAFDDAVQFNTQVSALNWHHHHHYN